MTLPTTEELVDWWLSRYHNTTCQEVLRLHPEEAKTPEWFKLYPCTQEQSDEWVDWAKRYIRQRTKFSKKFVDRQFPYVYLQCAPYVPPNTEDNG